MMLHIISKKGYRDNYTIIDTDSDDWTMRSISHFVNDDFMHTTCVVSVICLEKLRVAAKTPHENYSYSRLNYLIIGSWDISLWNG